MPLSPQETPVKLQPIHMFFCISNLRLNLFFSSNPCLADLGLIQVKADSADDMNFQSFPDPRLIAD